MPNLKQAVPFFMITNMEASLKFYVDGLGFEMKIKWMNEDKLEWCWLEHEGVALMLQQYKPAFVPKDKLGVGVSVCFICEDALAIYHEFIGRGIAASKPFVGNGMWVTGVTDPDGYRLEFESVTTVAEETEYDEKGMSS